MLPNSEQLHYECNKLLRRKSRVKIAQEISKKFNNHNYELKNSSYNNNYQDDIDNINPFIKFILCLCTKIEK